MPCKSVIFQEIYHVRGSMQWLQTVLCMYAWRPDQVDPILPFILPSSCCRRSGAGIPLGKRTRQTSGYRQSRRKRSSSVTNVTSPRQPRPPSRVSRARESQQGTHTLTHLIIKTPHKNSHTSRTRARIEISEISETGRGSADFRGRLSGAP